MAIARTATGPNRSATGPGMATAAMYTTPLHLPFSQRFPATRMRHRFSQAIPLGSIGQVRQQQARLSARPPRPHPLLPSARHAVLMVRAPHSLGLLLSAPPRIGLVSGPMMAIVQAIGTKRSPATGPGMATAAMRTMNPHTPFSRRFLVGIIRCGCIRAIPTVSIGQIRRRQAHLVARNPSRNSPTSPPGRTPTSAPPPLPPPTPSPSMGGSRTMAPPRSLPSPSRTSSRSLSVDSPRSLTRW